MFAYQNIAVLLGLFMTAYILMWLIGVPWWGCIMLGIYVVCRAVRDMTVDPWV